MSDNLLVLNEGKWFIRQRLELLRTLGPKLFDDDLDRFYTSAISVLKERDPKFDLHGDDRYLANIKGSVLNHSNTLRKGLAEGLALIGSHPKKFTNCSLHKPESIAARAVRDILYNADWVLWASLNDLLPQLAEADPDQFLEVVESALQRDPCPFKQLFAQEGIAITGSNYMTGLLWALETLAWDEQYLIRVTIILGELASIDPGGNWGNRPANSLTTIFLPWMPQTVAPFEKRKIAIQTLREEYLEVAWKLLISLLPNQHKMSTGSYKPMWRESIPKDWQVEVTIKEYWDQISYYADESVDIAIKDFPKLLILIGHFNDLPQSSSTKLLSYLESDEIINRSESNERISLSNKLTDLVSKYNKYPNAQWALTVDQIKKIEKVANLLSPKDPLHAYKPLFNGRDWELINEKGNWEEQQQNLEKRRQEAVRAIMKNNGLYTMIEFATSVESPKNLGFSLGYISDSKADSSILPNLLNSESQKLFDFSIGYIRGRYYKKGWNWVDKIAAANWSPAHISQLLISLPFTEETWKRVKNLLNENEIEYWKKVPVNPYESEGDINTAIDKLLEYDRPNAAINCLSKSLHDKQPLDQSRIIKALINVSSSKEPTNSMDIYQIVELIKALQNNPGIYEEDVSKVEWFYLSLLDEYNDASPKLLEQRLASNPEFFSEVIQLIYRSKKTDKNDKGPTEQQKTIATNVYGLLKGWRIPPGVQPDGTFSESLFGQWLKTVKSICTNSGHLEVAQIHVGNVLIYSPPDPDGLWIRHAIAKALNAKDAGEMRNGLHSGFYNSRGVHFVDPTGKPEKDLAVKYKKQADDVEKHGYFRLAVTLKSLASTYEQEAERIIKGYKDI